LHCSAGTHTSLKEFLLSRASCVFLRRILTSFARTLYGAVLEPFFE
jgi:hypothetical protein